MQIQNIAIVFGPTLLVKPPDKLEVPGNLALNLHYQSQIVDNILTEQHTCFTKKHAMVTTLCG